MPRKASTTLSKPSYREDRIAWNLAWEREHDALYGRDQTFSLKPGKQIVDMFKNIPLDDMLNDASLQFNLQFHHQICILQRDLTQKVSSRFGQHDFENRWMQKCTPKEREKWVLEGLVRTCEANPDFESFRRFCPEITIARMDFKSGKGFLDLVQGLILDDAEKVPEDIRKVPNPIWDAMNGGNSKNATPKQELLQRANDTYRTAFLTMFVWNTLLAFVQLSFSPQRLCADIHLQYGESQEYGVLKTSDNESRKLREYFRGKDSNQVKVYRDAFKNAHRGCTACGKTPEHAGVSKLQRCTKCMKIGRDVYYCSKYGSCFSIK